jgi:hypothetical protein
MDPRFVFIVEEEKGARVAAEELPRISIGVGAVGLDATTLEFVDPSVDEALLLEATHVDGRFVLLLAAPPGAGVQRNGRVPPPVALLETADQLQLRDFVLHLSRERNAQRIAPPQEFVGKRCNVCGIAFKATGDTIIVHDECGAPLHIAPEGADRNTALDCARVAACPCGKQVVCDDDGLLYVPEV